MYSILILVTCTLLVVDGRLPTDVQPLSYRLQLNVQNDESGAPTNYNGTVQIALNLKAPTTQNITLHASTGLTVTNVKLFMNVLNTTNAELETTYQQFDDTLRVSLTRGINPSPMISYSLQLEFEGRTGLDNEGFYRIEYQDPVDQTTKRYLACTQFESVSARMAFPCFDEPSFRAKFKLEIELASNWNAVSNMPLARTVNVSRERQIFEFEESPPMPTYLFAWYVADSATFGELGSTTVNGVRYAIHGRRSLQNQTAFALQEAPKIINELGTWLGVTYNATGMNKLDLVGLPEFNAGAMENWGLVTFREASLFYDEQYSSILDKRKIQMVIAHELAHQWFGDVVTLDWWSYTWLNEAFARLFQYIVPAEASSSALFLTDVKQMSMATDTQASHPLSNPDVESAESIDAMFDVITYGKGASILSMFNNGVHKGDYNMRTWLHRYLTERIESGGVAKPDDLWNALNDTVLAEKFKPWTEIAGHSVLVVEKNKFRPTLNLSHVKETMHGNRTAIDLDLPLNDIAMGNRLYSIRDVIVNVSVSILYAYETQWIRPNTTVELLSLMAEYYVLTDSRAYYRVLYDEENWRALKRQLTEELSKNIMATSLLPEVRMNLVSDSLNLMLSGYKNPTLAMDFVEFMVHERDLLVWKAALMAFDGIRTFLTGDPEALDHFDRKVRWLIEAGLDTNLNDATTPLPNTEMEIAKIFVINRSCKYNTENCTGLISRIGENWNQLEEYDRTFDGAIFCKYANSATANWENLFANYKKTNVPTQQRRYLGSLMCTADQSLQSKLLNVVTKQDIANVVVGICGAENGPKTVMTYIKNLGQGISKKYNRKTIKKMLNAVGANIYSQSDRNEFNNLLRTNLGLSDLEIGAIRKNHQDAISMKALVAGRVRTGLNMTAAPSPNLASATRPDNTIVVFMIVALVTCLISPYVLQKF